MEVMRSNLAIITGPRTRGIVNSFSFTLDRRDIGEYIILGSGSQNQKKHVKAKSAISIFTVQAFLYFVTFIQNPIMATNTKNMNDKQHKIENSLDSNS